MKHLLLCCSFFLAFVYTGAVVPLAAQMVANTANGAVDGVNGLTGAAITTVETNINSILATILAVVPPGPLRDALVTLANDVAALEAVTTVHNGVFVSALHNLINALPANIPTVIPTVPIPTLPSPTITFPTFTVPVPTDFPIGEGILALKQGLGLTSLLGLLNDEDSLDAETKTSKTGLTDFPILGDIIARKEELEELGLTRLLDLLDGDLFGLLNTEDSSRVEALALLTAPLTSILGDGVIQHILSGDLSGLSSIPGLAGLKSSLPFTQLAERLLGGDSPAVGQFLSSLQDVVSRPGAMVAEAISLPISIGALRGTNQ